jgi:hypothetical protein
MLHFAHRPAETTKDVLLQKDAAGHTRSAFAEQQNFSTGFFGCQ